MLQLLRRLGWLRPTKPDDPEDVASDLVYGVAASALESDLKHFLFSSVDQPGTAAYIMSHGGDSCDQHPCSWFNAVLVLFLEEFIQSRWMWHKSPELAISRIEKIAISWCVARGEPQEVVESALNALRVQRIQSKNLPLVRAHGQDPKQPAFFWMTNKALRACVANDEVFAQLIVDAAGIDGLMSFFRKSVSVYNEPPPDWTRPQ